MDIKRLQTLNHPLFNIFLSAKSKARREVANLTLRNNLHTPIYGVKEFVCLSVMNFVLNYLITCEIEWAEIW